ncbi:MAG: Bug family tripartite tricarboxylate transporter substrate binding protein [Burkholderiales bacterium]
MKRTLFLALLLACSLPVQAQFPSKPVRAIVAFGTGGATDVIARIVAVSMSQSLGQPVVIDNRPGADGIVAGEQLVKAAPDGYTVFFGTSTQISALPSLRKQVPFDPIADMTPIGGIGVNSFFWTVHPDLPVRTLKELAAYGRDNPGKLNAGSSSATASIAPTLFAAAENFKIQVIPYKSETTALNDLIGGRIQLVLVTGTLAQHVRDGRIRGLATMLTSRSKALPDLPTMAESGITPFAAIPWMGLFGPAKMPAEIVERLSRELLATLQKPEVREQIERQGMEINPLLAAGMGTLARDQTAVWRRLTNEAGIIPE